MNNVVADAIMDIRNDPNKIGVSKDLVLFALLGASRLKSEIKEQLRLWKRYWFESNKMSKDLNAKMDARIKSLDQCDVKMTNMKILV